MKFAAEKEIEVTLAEVDRIVKTLSLDSTLMDLVELSSASVRLRNSFKHAAQVNIAEMTIREYLEDAASRQQYIIRMSTLGMKTSLELDGLIKGWDKIVTVSEDPLNDEVSDRKERTNTISHYTINNDSVEAADVVNSRQKTCSFNKTLWALKL